MSLVVSITASELSVDPGGSVTGEVRVTSTAPGSRTVALRVSGPAAPWSWLFQPPDLTVAPGRDAVVEFGFRLPRAPQPPAGPLRFVLEATSDEATARVEGVVVVGTFGEVKVDLDPRIAGTRGTDRRRVTVRNEGNIGLDVRLSAASDDRKLELAVDPDTVRAEPGEEATAALTVRGRKRRPRGARPRAFVVSATPDQGMAVEVSGQLRHKAVVSATTARVLVAAAVLGLVAAVGGTVLTSDGGPDRVQVDGAAPLSTQVAAGVVDPRCVATGHIDTRVTGLTPEDIPTLPADFSFFNVAADGCTPVRWNPCEPIHYVINPANAPSTGLDDVREAFRRLSQVTGIAYVEEGMTDEAGQRREAYQPERYGPRWAPVLVQWQTSNSRSTETVAIVGGGFPTRAGDVYVTGNLFLNSGAVTNAATQAPLGGGFGDEDGVGPIGAEGVTWGRVILHELGHITGLGHVRDASQLMYPETTDQTIRPGRFGPGDANGLRLLGTEAGCLPTPPLDTPTRGQGGSGRR